MDLISVIIPVYKVEPYLDRCIRSVVEQTYENLEIILVDDGSPDNCGAMCDAWAVKDGRIRVIHKENGGLSAARNAGLAVASGEYISFIDSDDWVSTDFIYAMYKAIQDSGSDIAACDLVITSEDIDFNTAPGEYTIRRCSAKEAIGDILKGEGFRAVAWNKLYKSKFLKDERYPIGKHHEDEFFTYRILTKTNKLVYVNAALYAYFQRPGSIMRCVSLKRLDALDAYLERLSFLKVNYPDLYVKDKFSFCVSCVAFYRDAVEHKAEDALCMKEKIKQCRKEVCFCFRELRQASLCQLVYALGSAISLDAFCAVLNMRNKRRGKNG